MFKLLEFFNTEGVLAFKYLFGFLVLPFLYVHLSTQAHRIWADAWQVVAKIETDERFSDGILSFQQEMDAIYKRDLAAFHLDVWLVVASVIFLTGIFSLGEIGVSSGLLESSGDISIVTANRAIVIGMMNIYGLVIALFFAYYFHNRYLLIARNVGYASSKIFFERSTILTETR